MKVIKICLVVILVLSGIILGWYLYKKVQDKDLTLKEFFQNVTAAKKWNRIVQFEKV
jgi:hypothetical protein